MKAIITIEDLMNYLQVGNSNGKTNQEVLIRNITQEATFAEETMSFQDFGAQYKEVINIPKILYLDKHNTAYVKRWYTKGFYYRPITYEKNRELYTEKSIQEYVTKVEIPDEIYNGGYEFFINEQDNLVASLQVATLNSLSNYAAYQASAFSYLKSYPVVSYTYKSVYGSSATENIKVIPNTKSGLIHRFPIISSAFGTGYRYCLSYYYKKHSDEIIGMPLTEDDHQFIGLRIYFENMATVLQFVNETICNYYNEFTDYQSKYRNLFLSKLTDRVATAYSRSRFNEKMAIIYHLPQPLFYALEKYELWHILEDLAKGYVRNQLGINEEDLIIKLLRILYFRYTHERKVFTTDGTQVLEETAVGSMVQNTLFLKNLLSRKVDGSTLLLYKLITGLDGEHFKTYIRFLWKIWKSSAFANIDPTTNKEVAITEKSSVLLDYRSDKKLGFYVDNAEIDWEGSKSLIDILVTAKTGKFEEKEIEREDVTQKFLVEKKVQLAYKYHPFSPVVFFNSENPKFILKDAEDSDTLFTKLPAFVLFANKETAFWQNVLTATEYAVDIATTVSGVGNLLKAGRLVRLLKNRKTVFFKTKQLTTAITVAKTTAGVIEVSSGTVNTLLKLTSIDDTELGKSTTKYLFYLEMACLAGEVSVFLKEKLKSSGRGILKERKEFDKLLDKSVKDSKNPLTPEGKSVILKEIESIADLDLEKNLKDYIEFRPKFIHNVSQTTKLWRAKSLIPITKHEIIELFTKHLDDYSGLVKGHNQADFNIKFYDNGKQFDEVAEFSLSGDKDKILTTFGNPPDLPPNTIDVFKNYDEFITFVTGAYDLTGRARKYDSEIKFVYNFLKNHVHKADEFVIETSNIFATCTSCSREFVMLEEYLKTLGKKVKFVIKTDEKVKGFKELKIKYPEIKKVIKKHQKEYRKIKTKK